MFFARFRTKEPRKNKRTNSRLPGYRESEFMEDSNIMKEEYYDPTVTMNIYTHLSSQKKEKAVQALQQHFTDTFPEAL